MLHIYWPSGIRRLNLQFASCSEVINTSKIINSEKKNTSFFLSSGFLGCIIFYGLFDYNLPCSCLMLVARDV